MGNSFALENIDGFIIGNGSFGIGDITTDQIIAVYMNADSIEILSVFCHCFADTVIDVIDLQILTAEVGGITVLKTVISSGNSITFDTVS